MKTCRACDKQVGYRNYCGACMRIQNVVLEKVYGKHKPKKHARVDGMTVKQLVVLEYIRLHGPCRWADLPWQSCMTLRKLKDMGKLVFEKVDEGYVWRMA